MDLRNMVDNVMSDFTPKKCFEYTRFEKEIMGRINMDEVLNQPLEFYVWKIVGNFVKEKIGGQYSINEIICEVNRWFWENSNQLVIHAVLKSLYKKIKTYREAASLFGNSENFTEKVINYGKNTYQKGKHKNINIFVEDVIDDMLGSYSYKYRYIIDIDYLKEWAGLKNMEKIWAELGKEN